MALWMDLGRAALVGVSAVGVFVGMWFCPFWVTGLLVLLFLWASRGWLD